MPNHDSNGIAFGVISGNSLDPDVLADLTSETNTIKNITYAEAYADAMREFEREWDDIRSSALSQCPAAEFKSSEYRDDAIELKMEEIAGGSYEDFIDNKTNEFNENYQADEEVYEGEHEGVKFRVSWLGGAIIVFVMESPVTTWARPCSPCVLGAVSLDSLDPDGVECYDVPLVWRAK